MNSHLVKTFSVPIRLFTTRESATLCKLPLNSRSKYWTILTLYSKALQAIR